MFDVDDFFGEPKHSPEPEPKKQRTLTKKYTLDLYKQVLPALDRRDTNFFSKLTSDEQKGFSPLVAMKAMTSYKNNEDFETMYVSLILTNDMVNFHFYDYSKHPELVARLLAHTTVKEGVKWVGRKNIPLRRSDKLYTLIEELCPDLSEDEIDILIAHNSIDDWTEIVKTCGFQDKDVKKFITDLKKLIK